MSRSKEAFFNQPGENINGLRALTHDDHHAAYVYHRDRLVDLGAVTRHHFVLVPLVRPSAEAQHFIKWLMSRTESKCIDWTCPVEPDAPLSITLWCDPAQSKEWQDLMQDHDIPDYANVFMKDSDSSSTALRADGSSQRMRIASRVAPADRGPMTRAMHSLRKTAKSMPLRSVLVPDLAA